MASSATTPVLVLVGLGAAAALAVGVLLLQDRDTPAVEETVVVADPSASETETNEGSGAAPTAETLPTEPAPYPGEAPPSGETEEIAALPDNAGTREPEAQEDTSEAATAPVANEAPEQGSAEDPQVPAPTFDVVRISAEGSALVAGRAPASSRVTVELDGEAVAEAATDRAGTFAALFDVEPAPRARVIFLVATLADGRKIRSSDSAIVTPQLPAQPEDEPIAVAEAPVPAPDAEEATEEQTAPAEVASAEPEERPVLPETGTVEPEERTAPPEAATVEVAEAPSAEDSVETSAPESSAAEPQAPTATEAEPDAKTEVAALEVPETPAAGATAPSETPEEAPDRTAPAGATATQPTPSAPDAPTPATDPAPDLPVETPERVASSGTTPQTARPERAPTVILSGPEGVSVLTPGERTAAALGSVIIDAISYDEQGQVVIEGRGGEPASADRVQLYLDNRPLRLIRIEENGFWRVRLSRIEPGVYTLRADQIDGEGKVVSRFETPFKREDTRVLASAGATIEATAITVQPGFTLWGIASDRYGDGFQYVQIFEANQDQIKDPDLIYPGQIFDLPDID